MKIYTSSEGLSIDYIIAKGAGRLLCYISLHISLGRSGYFTKYVCEGQLHNEKISEWISKHFEYFTKNPIGVSKLHSGWVSEAEWEVEKMENDNYMIQRLQILFKIILSWLYKIIIWFDITC